MNISEEEYSEEYILKVKLLIVRRQGVEEIFYHGLFHKNIYIPDISAFLSYIAHFLPVGILTVKNVEQFRTILLFFCLSAGQILLSFRTITNTQYCLFYYFLQTLFRKLTHITKRMFEQFFMI